MDNPQNIPDGGYVYRELESATRSLIEAIGQFSQRLAVLEKDLNKNCWVSPSQIPEILGSGFSSGMVRNLIRSGELTYGVHYLNTSNGEKPNYLVNPLQIERYFLVPPEYRED